MGLSTETRWERKLLLWLFFKGVISHGISVCRAQSGHWLLLLAVWVFTELQRLSVRFLSKFFVSLDNTGLRTWKGENPKSEDLIQCYLKWPLVC